MTHIDRFMIGLLLGLILARVIVMHSDLTDMRDVKELPVLECHTMYGTAPYFTIHKMDTNSPYDGKPYYWIRTDDGTGVSDFDCYFK